MFGFYQLRTGSKHFFLEYLSWVGIQPLFLQIILFMQRTRSWGGQNVWTSSYGRQLPARFFLFWGESNRRRRKPWTLREWGWYGNSWGVVCLPIVCLVWGLGKYDGLYVNKQGLILVSVEETTNFCMFVLL